MATSIKDIAQRVGVSHVTVSHALRGKPVVLASTRDRIVRAAREMGYRPNASASAIRNGRFGNVALLQSAGPARSFMPPELLKGIHDALAEQDMQLTLEILSDELLTSAQYVPRMLRKWSADGLLINYIAKIPQRMIELIRACVLPSIWLNSQQDSDCIHPDDHGGGRQAAEHLLQLGHRRFAFMDFSAADHYSAIDRFEGFAQTVRSAGWPVRLIGDPARRHVPESERAGLVRNALGDPDRPTALLINGEYALLPLLMALPELDLKAPRDLSIVTIDTHAWNHLGMAMTTLILPERELGRGAVRMLNRKMLKPAEALPNQVVQLKLEPGESSGAAGLSRKVHHRGAEGTEDS